MNRKWVLGIIMTAFMLLASVPSIRSQNLAEPPDPPDPPEPPQIWYLNDGYSRLGVSLEEVTPEKAQELKLPTVAGALVTKIEADSSAAKAGLEKGDVIVEFDGVRVRSSAELRRLVRETPAGRTVAIKVLRGGQTRTLEAKLEAPGHPHPNFVMPEMTTPPINLWDYNFSFGPGHASLGISGDDLTPQLAQFFGVKQGKGVLVREVMVGSAAEKSGLKAGDVIVQVDAKPVGSVDELRAALNQHFTDDTRKVQLTLVRDHREQTLTVELTRSSPQHRRIDETVLVNPDAIASMVEQAGRVRIDAEQLRQAIQQQKEMMQGEWQRQLREQLRGLKEQLKNQPSLLTLRHTNNEI